MIDPATLPLLGNLASLAADFLKAQSDRKDGQATRDEAARAAEFRAWLENDIFPQLLAHAEQTLRSVVSLKTTQHERYEELLEHVLAIRRAVADTTPIGEWSTLGELDQLLLTFVYQRTREEPRQGFDHSDLPSGLGATELAASATYLSEREWLKCIASARGWHFAPEAAGVLLAWAVNDPKEYREAVDRLKAALSAPNAMQRLGALAIVADVPLGLTYFAIKNWAQQSLLTFNEDTSPFEAALIYNVSESFRRSIRQP